MRTDPPAAAFEALGDPVRCGVLERLGERPHSAGELAELAGVSPSSMSRHLRTLLRAELITDERGSHDARVRMFRLHPEGLAATTAWLDQVQAHWRSNLASFKAHVEG
ncbi:MAG TPA: metalloregulator ArsR/SmtB family transcription factor [Ornithinicoccus sp.]|nr:metalloregulator ArsR/SmtB family transcription factor [Ornithinicoccus sp.]